MESNDILDKLPRHLMSLVIDQPYNEYTSQDHAVWRYVMRHQVNYLPAVAHPSYLRGLSKAGIHTETIPEMYGMNRILKDIGWAAVAVDGFIPPSAFMEFQAYNVLVIAADIRTVNQILYTPAPDIIHEAAGHAPIIADAEYSEYLTEFGQLGNKVFSSPHDHLVYEAIRHLSILKADPASTNNEILQAEKELESISEMNGPLSEMAQLRNLHWWTVEYGLFGDTEKPLLYGAGLLSSIGESRNCLNPNIKKLPYSLDACRYTFDITTQQPQLFVTPDFKHLKSVLKEFADTTAKHIGGLESLKKAKQSGATATIEYSSGVQVSGILSEVLTKNTEPVYLQFSGSCMLSHQNKQLDGHGTSVHSEGFGSPVGKLAGDSKSLEYMSLSELETMGIKEGEQCKIVFSSGVVVKGNLSTILRKEEKNLIFSFDECLVEFENKNLFKPEWGKYDMAVGALITSVFAGSADAEAFGLNYKAPKEKTHRINHNNSELRLFEYYSKIRKIRVEGGTTSDCISLWESLKANYSEEWLLGLEIMEDCVTNNRNKALQADVLTFLKAESKKNNDLKSLISCGLELIKISV
jgi:phenylalanine-4-hydroxylase